jgi:hypothetical protein
VDLAATPVTLGMPLTMDPAAERFTASPEADAMLTRKYRAPFVVPESV